MWNFESRITQLYEIPLWCCKDIITWNNNINTLKDINYSFNK